MAVCCAGSGRQGGGGQINMQQKSPEAGGVQRRECCGASKLLNASEGPSLRFDPLVATIEAET